MPNTNNYLKQFVAFAIEKLQQDPSLESFKEHLITEARTILNNASGQNVSTELPRLERFLQSEIKYQLLQYRKRHSTAVQ